MQATARVDVQLLNVQATARLWFLFPACSRGHIFEFDWLVVCLRKSKRQHGWIRAHNSRMRSVLLEQKRKLRSVRHCGARANESRQACWRNPVFEDHTTHLPSIADHNDARVFFLLRIAIVSISHGTILHSSCGSAGDSLALTARRGRIPCSRETHRGNQAGDGAVATCAEEETRREAKFGRPVLTALS